MNRLIRDDLAERLMAGLERENALYLWARDHEPWEARLRREVWRRSLRGRWWWFRYRLAQRTEPVRRRIAQRIYYFREDD